MNRNYNYWGNGSKGNTNTKESKTEAPKTRFSICNKEGYVGIYCDDESQIIDVEFFNETSIASLQALESLLSSIPTNDECLTDSISIIYVPDMISALVTGGVADYIRLGKNKSGVEIEKDKLDLYISIEEMARERSYNAVLRGYNFQDKVFQAKAIAWIKESARSATAKANGKERIAPQSNTVTSSTNPAIDALNKQILEAVATGDFNKAKELGELIAIMSGQKVQEEQKGGAEA